MAVLPSLVNLRIVTFYTQYKKFYHPQVKLDYVGLQPGPVMFTATSFNFVSFLRPIHVVTFTLISNLVTDYIQKRI